MEAVRTCKDCGQSIDANEGYHDRPLCGPCYWQDYKRRNLLRRDKTCVECGTNESFKWYAGPKCGQCYNNKKSRDTYAANPEKYKDYQKEFRKKFPEKIKAQNLRKFGITLSDYRRMYAEQEGRCAICRSSSPGRKGIKFFPVDHDHATGKVRSLLCSWCNKGIGLLKDDPTLLRVAAEYIERHKPK